MRRVKDAATHQIESISGATSSYYNGLKKSLTECSKEVGRVARSFSEFVDVEDVLKSVHKATHPKEHAARKSSIVHKPIDWSKYPPSAYRKCSQVRPPMVTEDEANHQLEELMIENEEKKHHKSLIDENGVSIAKLSSGSDENATKDTEKRLKKKSISNRRGIKRSQTFSHKRASPTVEQNIYFHPSSPDNRSPKRCYQTSPSNKPRHNFVKNVHSQKLENDIEESSSCEEINICTQHLDINPRNGLSRSQSLNYKNIDRNHRVRIGRETCVTPNIDPGDRIKRCVSSSYERKHSATRYSPPMTKGFLERRKSISLGNCSSAV